MGSIGLFQSGKCNLNVKDRQTVIRTFEWVNKVTYVVCRGECNQVLIRWPQSFDLIEMSSILHHGFEMSCLCNTRELTDER